MQAPIINEDLWEDTPEQAYYTVRLYNHSGIGIEQERVNVLTTSDQDAKEIFRSNYRISQSSMYRLYAFKQSSKI